MEKDEKLQQIFAVGSAFTQYYDISEKKNKYCRGYIVATKKWDDLRNFTVVESFKNNGNYIDTALTCSMITTGNGVQVSWLVQPNYNKAAAIRNPDNSKAMEILNWKPRIDLKNGLKSLLEKNN